MCPDSGPSGEFLLVIATLVSLQIAEGKSAEEIELIAAFFDVLANNLALIAVRRPAAPSTTDASTKQAAEADKAHRIADL